MNHIFLNLSKLYLVWIKPILSHILQDKAIGIKRNVQIGMIMLHNMVFLTSKHWFPQKLTKLPEHSDEQIQQQNVAEQDVESQEGRHDVGTERRGGAWGCTVAIEERVTGTVWLLHYKGETSKSQNKSNTIYIYIYTHTGKHWFCSWFIFAPFTPMSVGDFKTRRIDILIILGTKTKTWLGKLKKNQPCIQYQ